MHLPAGRLFEGNQLESFWNFHQYGPWRLGVTRPRPTPTIKIYCGNGQLMRISCSYSNTTSGIAGYTLEAPCRFDRSVVVPADPAVHIYCSYSSTISGIAECKSVTLHTCGRLTAVPDPAVLGCLILSSLTSLPRCHIADSTGFHPPDLAQKPDPSNHIYHN